MSGSRQPMMRRMLQREGRIHTFYGTSDRVGKKVIKTEIKHNPNEKIFPVSNLLALFGHSKKVRK